MGENSDRIRRKFAAMNAKDAEAMTSIYGPGVVKEVPGGELRGPDQILAFVSAFWEAFPDLEVTVTSAVEEGPVVAIRATITGTHLGVFHTPAGDLPPTGRSVNLNFSDDYAFEDGLVVSTHLHLDRLALLEQLGALPAPTPA
jgi:predicted ester cyclase